MSDTSADSTHSIHSPSDFVDLSENPTIWNHYFSSANAHPYEQIKWKTVDSCIRGPGGKIAFEQHGVEVPQWWSATTTNIVASKYFRYIDGKKENSVRQVFSRVASTLKEWGKKSGYFATDADADIYERELIWLLLHQFGAFNSPVWFNLGVPGREQQASACFISSVADTLDDICEFSKSEKKIFSGGSGSGANFSSIRSSYEKLSSGAYVCGPLGWMEELDKGAKAMKSGGSCLAPYTKVYTEKGPIDVKSLAESEKEFIVLSYDPPAGRYKAKKATAWHAGEKNVVRITTDKGQFDLSDDHPIKLNTGEYLAAGKLLTGQSLFSCIVDDHAGHIRVNLRDGQKGREEFHQIISRDIPGIENFSATINSDHVKIHIEQATEDDGYTSDDDHKVLSVEVIGTMDVYDVNVQCPTDDDKSVNTGHNFVIWSGDSYVGSGFAVANTRNAAKMAVLDMSHPDILVCKDGRPGFIRCKAVEEKRAHDLIDIGYGAAYDDPNSAYKWVSFQNANHSVSVPDAFMKAVENDGDWETKDQKGNTVNTHKAKDLWREIAQAAWFCGDPGIQYTDVINVWHTTPVSGRINASNPCSEYLHVDDTACNLCALNLTKFFNGKLFHQDKFAHAVRTFVVAQNAIIDNASYPTEKITVNSHALRPIGLNYGDLGALLMKLGYGYDSDGGRSVAALMASFMTGYAYLTSAGLAKATHPFPEFDKNKAEMISVMSMHRSANEKISLKVQVDNWTDVAETSAKLWDRVIEEGNVHGYTISQASLLAPLGTISFLMGMDTTGVEPAFSLVSYKELVGGGSMKLASGAVPAALENLGYSDDDVRNIVKFIEENDFIEGAPGFNEKHLPVFDCAMPQGPSGRYLSPEAHVKMMGAIQPLITCAQSKTVNLPPTATVEDIERIYMMSWKLGVKCIALYRDGCKRSQPLSAKKEEKATEKDVVKIIEVTKVKRRNLPESCQAFRHRFEINGYKGYIITSEYDDGTLGEVFLKLGKSGSTLDGVIDGFTKLLSIALQHGIPLDKLIGGFINTKFDPSGFTRNPEIRFCQSLYDYLFKYLDLKYFDGRVSGIRSQSEKFEETDGVQESVSKSESASEPPASKRNIDAPPCGSCGSMTQRNGNCYLCSTCGSSSGCS